MPSCLEAAIKEIITLSPDNTVREAMDIFKKNDIRSMPVVDSEGKFLGLVGLRHVLLKLLPKSVTMEDGLESLEFLHDATPGIAKKLRKLYLQPVSEIMDANHPTIDPKTAMFESVRIMAKYGSPVPIVDEDTKKLEGLISRQTLLVELDRNIALLDEAE